MDNPPRPNASTGVMPQLFAPVPELDPLAYDRLAADVHGLLGVDLRQYKPAQVWRRVHGFASARGLAGPDALIARSRQDPILRQAFLDMLTINVSEFFRNPEAWEMLRKRFLVPLLARQPAVRVWSAGCSLGYEPYGIAMLIRELSSASARILATDLDETILARARTSVYKEAQMEGVSAARRARFFRQAGEDAWEVRPDLRAMVEFRRHDLLKDPYERNFDLIVCRNVVIYFTETAKTELYRRFRDSLKPGGTLFLGATESIPSPRNFGLAPVALTFYGRADP